MYEETENQYQAEALFEDLIEAAFLAGLISGAQQALAYLLAREAVDSLH